MASTRPPSQAERVASSARPRAAGGCIFAGAHNAVTSAAVTLHRIGTHRNIMPRPVTPSSRASSRASTGSTTIVRKRCSPARSFPLLERIRRISRCPDRPERCRQTGKRCSTNSGCVLLTTECPLAAHGGVRGEPGACRSGCALGAAWAAAVIPSTQRSTAQIHDHRRAYQGSRVSSSQR
jgi:hypothetical protein